MHRIEPLDAHILDILDSPQVAATTAAVISALRSSARSEYDIRACLLRLLVAGKLVSEPDGRIRLA